MEYKSIEEVISCNRERMDRVRDQFSAGSNSDDDVEIVTGNQKIFSLSSFIQNHKEVKFENLTNFSSEELDELIRIVEENQRFSHRGRQSSVSPKGCLFLALTYFTTYVPLETLSGIVGVKVPTLDRIIKRVINEFFPAFIKKFIPTDIPRSRISFVNFPDAVGAIDSTTIRTYRPQKNEMQKATWDAKNRVNGVKLQALVNPEGRAIHISTKFLGGTHDKKCFDISEVTKFVTVKRGISDVILPILADRGYVGIEKYHQSAIVQQRGHSKEIIERNAFIAKDRQIVERFFGRYKLSWGIVSEGYRGDYRKVVPIIQGLVALTNYLIWLHPLTNKDANETGKIEEEVEEEENEDNETSKDMCETKQDIVGEALLIVPKRHPPSYTLEITEEFIGIQNQGATCHINAVLQVLFRITKFRQAVFDSRDMSPAKEIAEIFNVMMNPGSLKDHVISTVRLTNVISPQWQHMQDCCETYGMFIEKVNGCIRSKTGSDDILNLFRLMIHNPNNTANGENWIFLNLYANYSAVQVGIRGRLKEKLKVALPPIFAVNLGRKAETGSFKWHNAKYSFPLELDMTQYSSNDNVRYQLMAIIAYANLHFISFIKINDMWNVFDDENIYTCKEEDIYCLFGGKEKSQQSNHLWERTNPFKWVAKLLFYREIHFEV